MDYYWRGRFLVFVGTVLFAIGGIIATYGWNIWSRQFDKKKYLREGVWDIIRGTILVALAGLLTTYGWNVISLGGQRNNLIRAIAQELLMNFQLLESPPIKGEVSYKNEDGRVVPRPFPVLKTAALNAVMSSGLWDIGNEAEKKFLYAIEAYERKIGTANHIFDEYNEFVLKTIDPNEKIASAKKFRKAAPEKDYFKSLENKQNEVIRLILSAYKWSIPPKERELLLQRIGEEPTISKPERLQKMTTASLISNKYSIAKSGLLPLTFVCYDGLRLLRRFAPRNDCGAVGTVISTEASLRDVKWRNLLKIDS